VVEDHIRQNCDDGKRVDLKKKLYCWRKWK